MPYVLEMVREVKALGLETCMTFGMLNRSQAERLHEAGLDYYDPITSIPLVSTIPMSLARVAMMTV